MIFAKRFLMVPATLLAASLALPATAHADNLQDLETTNPLPNPNLIFPGQVLTLPGGAGNYTVRQGDTLALIANAQPAAEMPPPAPFAPPVLFAPPAPAQPPAPLSPLLEPASAPPELPAPAPRALRGAARSGVNWDAVATCESGNNWAIDTHNGFVGGLQWAPGTWAAYRAPGDPTYAAAASREQQIAAADRLYAVSGLKPWPVCGRRG